MKKAGACTVWLFLGVALAFGPEAALERRPPGYEALVADVEMAGWEAEFARLGLGGSASAGYGDDWQYGVSLRLSLDPARRLQADLAALEARQNLRGRVRNAVYQGLTLHARAWRAQVEREVAARVLEEAELRREAARVQGRGPLDLEELAYAVEDARLGLDLAEAELAEVREEAREAGFAGAVEPRVLRFLLPEPEPDRVGELRLRRQRAAAAGAWRNLVVLGAQVQYLGEVGYTFEAASAGPDLSFSLQRPAVPVTNEWKFGVSARIVLDPTAWTGARRTGLAAESYAAERRLQEDERTRKLAALRRRAEAAWTRLQLAHKRAGLARARAAQLEARLSEGLVARLDVLSAQVAALRAASRTAEAWRAYLDAVKAYLDLVDGDWRVE